jgi:ketosteroid isomerase-like protein
MSNSIEARLRRLEDRAEIGELVTRYCLAMDNRDTAEIPRLFAADACVRSLDGIMNATGRDAILAMFMGRFAVLGPSNHVTHDRIVKFDEATPDLAHGIVLSHAEMQRKGQPMVTAIRYLDKYRRDVGAWCFAERVLAFMYYVPTAEYLDAFGQGIATRMRAYETPAPADWPENLPTWRRYYGLR